MTTVSTASRFIKWPDVIMAAKKELTKFFAPHKKVILYGESGAGKTQFLQTILGNGVIVGSRTYDGYSENLVLEDGHIIEFIDTPGHQSLKPARKNMITMLAKGEIDGIINMVNYGYLSTELTPLDTVFKVGSNEVKEEYLRENRKRELEQVKEWMEFVNANGKVRWILTVVNKADIWYANYNDVLDYYRQGDYYKQIEALHHVADLPIFPFCSIIRPFCGRPMLLAMGEAEKRDMHSALYKEIINRTFPQ